MATHAGDVTLYVSTTTTTPNATNYEWTSGHDPHSRGDHVAIAHNDAKFVTGIYYIGLCVFVVFWFCGKRCFCAEGVYAFKDSRFSLSFTTGAVLLRAGMPQIGGCKPNNAGSFYFLQLDLPQGQKVCSVSVINC